MPLRAIETTIQLRKIQNEGIVADQAGMLVRLGDARFMSNQKEDRGGTSRAQLHHRVSDHEERNGDRNEWE